MTWWSSGYHYQKKSSSQTFWTWNEQNVELYQRLSAQFNNLLVWVWWIYIRHVSQSARGAPCVKQDVAPLEVGELLARFSYYKKRHLPADPVNLLPSLSLPTTSTSSSSSSVCCPLSVGLSSALLRSLRRRAGAGCPDTCCAPLNDQEGEKKERGEGESVGRTWWALVIYFPLSQKFY